MPINAVLPYITAKHIKETRRDTYMMDCLWVLATEQKFTAYPRWQELTVPKKQVKPDTGSNIMRDLMNAW